MVGNRGHDADTIRPDIEEYGAIPVIPTKKIRKIRSHVDGAVFVLSNRTERCFNDLKNSRRLAIHHRKFGETFHDFVNLVSTGSRLPRFVSRT